ncbi:hypothetical protein Tco_1571151 [Tanacetum coccineum]
MVTYLEKTEGSEGFHQIIDFLIASHINYALTESSTIYASLIKQFWQPAALSTIEDRVMEITATIDGRVKTINEASIRRHLKLEDSDGISTLPTTEIFKQLALMGYVTTSDSLTFQKGHFSPQWKFLIHTILYCLSPKKTAWEQFSSNIATTIICLATNKTFNFSNLIFEAMVKNIDSKTMFFMYLRFIQIFLNKHQRLLLPHKRTYPTPTVTQKLFSNMKRASKGYSGVNTPLFQTMLVQDQGERPTISVVSHHTPTSGPSTSQPPSIQTTPVAEETTLMPHDLPLPRVHSHGSDEGSLSLNELTVLCTSLSKKVEGLESELKQTKHAYSTTLIKLIKRVKKLEQTIKISQARRRAKVVISDAEEDEEDSSKQGRSLIEELDIDAGISLVPPHFADQGRFDDTHVSNQPKEQLGVFSVAKVLADAAEQRRDVENVQTYTRRRIAVSTGSGGVSIDSELVSTAGVKVKDKGKVVMQESEPLKKIKKRVQVQMSIDEELAQKVHEEEHARFNAEQEAKFNAEQEQERLDHETAMKIQEELDAAERQKMAQVHQAAQGFTDDEWDDILARVAADKYFVQQLQACEKVSDEDLPRKLVKLVNQRKKFFAQQRAEAKRNKPMTPAQQKEYMSTYIKNQEGGYTLKQLKALSFEEVKEIFEATMKPTKRQRTGEALGSVQEQTCKEPKVEELSQEQLHQMMMVIPVEEVELKRLFEPDDNDTLWKLQRYMHDPLNWWLYDTCGVHDVSTERGHDIYMLVEKDYPLTKALITLMLCNKLRVDQYSDMAEELLKKIFILVERPRQ